jgi:hypothetical protein
VIGGGDHLDELVVDDTGRVHRAVDATDRALQPRRVRLGVRITEVGGDHRDLAAGSSSSITADAAARGVVVAVRSKPAFTLVALGTAGDETVIRLAWCSGARCLAMTLSDAADRRTT